MKRIPHHIRPNHKVAIPTHAIWFDTETDWVPQPDGSSKAVLRFGWLCYKRRDGQNKWRADAWHRFTTPREFWDIVNGYAKGNTRIYLFCHNTNFDPLVLDFFRIPQADGWKMTKAIIDAPPTIVQYKRDGATLLLLDTLNFWRGKLAALGDSIGLPKLECDLENAPAEEQDRYCRRDVEIIQKACLEWWAFLRENDMGGFASTLAGQSMRIWRHKYMKAHVLIDTDERALEVARASYFGGRTEVFRHGYTRGPIYSIDFNSMYPSVMRNRKYPARLRRVLTDFQEQSFQHYRASCCMIAEVDLNTPEPVFPYLHEGRLCFPVGQFRATLAGPELEYAVDHGYVTSWGRLIVYEAEELFTDFVNDMYALRLKYKAIGDSLMEQFYKILLNSLYGKFGQRGIVWETVGEFDYKQSLTDTHFNADTGVVTKFRVFGGSVQRQSRDAEGPESHPAICSYVCSYARMEAWRILRLVGRENMIYMDTDGFYLLKPGFDRLGDCIHPTELGKLKHENTYRRMIVYGLKDYSVDGCRKIKGVRDMATKVGHNEYQQEQWSGLSGQIARGMVDAPTIRPIRKKLSRTYTKGHFMADGTVSPITLGGV